MIALFIIWKHIKNLSWLYKYLDHPKWTTIAWVIANPTAQKKFTCKLLGSRNFNVLPNGEWDQKGEETRSSLKLKLKGEFFFHFLSDWSFGQKLQFVSKLKISHVNLFLFISFWGLNQPWITPKPQVSYLNANLKPFVTKSTSQNLLIMTLGAGKEPIHFFYPKHHQRNLGG